MFIKRDKLTILLDIYTNETIFSLKQRLLPIIQKNFSDFALMKDDKILDDSLVLITPNSIVIPENAVLHLVYRDERVEQWEQPYVCPFEPIAPLHNTE